MDKRGARILFGCLGGTVFVILLFFLASRLTRPSCELIIIEQTQFRSSALADWPKDKPVRSHDKTTLFKISAYLEYNVQSSKDKSQTINSSGTNRTSPEQQDSQQQPQQPNQQVQVPAQASSQTPTASGGKGPTPSIPQTGITNQQLANSSQLFNSTSGADSSKSEKPRFLPMELEDIEVKKLEDNRYTYTLNFNCSTMKMIVVRKSDRVFVEKITMELKPESQKKSKCELQLPTAEMFSTEVAQPDGWAHYYCDKSFKFNCYHRSTKHADLLLAELHINAIEFETTGIGGSNHSIHKDRKFLGARSPSARCPM